MGTFIQHIPCDNCGSSDANSLYADGSTYCFACEAVGGEGSQKRGRMDKPKDFLTGSYQDLTSRKIPEDICRKYGYQVGDYKGEKCHIANYRTADERRVGKECRSRWSPYH